jgi:hypothetical protein
VGGFDESIEESGVGFGRFFRVPLHGNAKVDGGQFNAFDDPIRSSRRNDEVTPHVVDCLVVVHLSARDVVSHNAGQMRPTLNGDIHGGKSSATLLVVIVANHFGEMLDEVSALVHVEHLRSSTDAQKGQVCGDCRSKQVILQSIAIATWFVCRLVGLLTVASRVDVFTSRNDESIEARHNVSCRVSIGWLGGQENGHAAGSRHGAEVDLGKK